MFRMKNLVRPVAYPAIDGIRAYAAFSVFVLHIGGGAVLEYFKMPPEVVSYSATSWWWKALTYLLDGNRGVDVFFIISGFLMARIVLSDRAPFSYGKFLTHRFWRIYPAFLISIVITAAVDVQLFGWQWKPLDFLKNLVFLNAVPSLGVIPYNHVSWSLGYEFAFYLIVPVLTLAATVMDKRLGAIAMFIAAAILLPVDFIRMLGLFAGAAVGAMDDATLRRIARSIPLWAAMGAYVCGGLFKGFWLGASAVPAHIHYFVFLPFAVLAFVKVVWDENNLINRLFSSVPMRALGTLSYSFYLFHPVIGSTVLHKLTPWPASMGGLAWYVGLSLALTLMAAYVSYTLLEQLYFMRRQPTLAAKVGPSAADNHVQWVQPNSRTPQ